MPKSPRLIIAAGAFVVLLIAVVTLAIFGVGADVSARLEGMLALVFPALLAESAVQQIQRRKASRAQSATSPRAHAPEVSTTPIADEPTVPGKPQK